MTLKSLMILERSGNSPALTTFCLPLSTDLKVFNGFNDFNVPIFPNVLFPLKKTPRRLHEPARTRRNPAKNPIRSRLASKSRNPLSSTHNRSNLPPIYTHQPKSSEHKFLLTMKCRKVHSISMSAGLLVGNIFLLICHNL